MYKVFYLAKEIIFAQSIKDLDVKAGDMVFENPDKEVITAICKEFISQQETSGRIIYLSEKGADFIFKLFNEAFENIDAAGGLVINQQNLLLMINRFGKWDLPKGKIEQNELPPVAALREVIEETGINDLKIISSLPSTYHLFHLHEKLILKKTQWYEMSCNDEKTPVPQSSEGIREARWMNKEEVKSILDNTYDSLLNLLEWYLQK